MKTHWIVTGNPKLAAVKYFWYLLRCKYRDDKYATGFYAGFNGLPWGSKNLDYIQGYKNAVTTVQAQAEAHNEWAEGYGWISNKIHRGEPFDGFVISALKRSEKYKEGVRAAIKAELVIERTRQATLELNRVEVEGLKKSRADWYKAATVRLEILEKIKEDIEEEL